MTINNSKTELMMKVKCIVLLLMMTTLAFGQATQLCVVKQYNQQKPKTPLSGVTVFAQNSNTAVSGIDGKLKLSFITLKPGHKIRDVVASKAGYEIFNKDVVNNWIISRDQSIFELLMVQSDYFLRYKTQLKKVSQDNYRKKYEQAERDLLKLQEEGKMKEEVLLKQYQELNERYQEALKKLDKHIDFFARIDLSEITTKEQQILKMIEEGKMDEAVKAYADLGLVKKLSAEVGSLEVMKEEEQRIYDEQARSKAVIDETYNVMQRWAATLTLQGQEEESEAVLDSLLDIISPLYKLVPEEYGPKVAHLHYLLGNYALKDILDDRYDEAKEHFMMAEQLYTEISVRNPELYRTALAQAQEGIAQALADADNLEEAELHYIDAMTNWSIMLDINPNDNDFRAGLAQVQHKLGNLYLELYQDNAFGILFNEDKDTTSTNVKRILSIKTNAESLFSKVFENYNAIISNNSSQYRLALAKAQGDLGRFYMSFNDYAKSENLLTALIQNMESAVAEHDSVIFVKEMVGAQTVLAGEVYRCLGQTEKREDCLLAALENCFQHLDSSPEEIAWTFQCVFDDIYNLYAAHFPEKEEHFLKTTLNKINHLYSDNGNDRILLLKVHIEDVYFKHLEQSNKYTLAETICKEKLNYYKPLFLKNPELYKDRLSYYYGKLRDIYGKNDESVDLKIATYLDEVKLWEKIYEQNSEKYCLDLCNHYLYCGEFYSKIDDNDRAKEYYQKGVNVISGSKQFPSDMNIREERAILLVELGKNSKKFIERENFYLSALEDYSNLYQQAPNRYLNDWLLIQERLGIMYFNQSIYNKAEEHLKLVLEKRIEHFNSLPYFTSDRVWDTLDEIDKLYRRQKEYSKSEQLWLNFRDNCESLFSKKELNKDMYDVLEKAYINLGTYYSSTDDYNNAIQTYSTILKKGLLLFKEDHELYRRNIAKLHETIGYLYSSVFNNNRNYANAIEHYSKAKELYDAFPDYYRKELAHLQENMGLVYWRIYQKEKTFSDMAEDCLLNASDKYYYLWQHDFGQLSTSSYKENYMHIQLLLGDFYYDLNNKNKAQKHYYRVLEYQNKKGNSKELMEKMRERGLLKVQSNN